MRFYLLLVLLALTISGCAESDFFIHEGEQSPRAELSISPHYLTSLIKLQAANGSRNESPRYLPDGSEIGVFVHALSSGQCTHNLRWRAFGSEEAQQWRNINSSGEEEKYYLNNQYSRLFSYYPYTDNPEDLIISSPSDKLNEYLPALRVSPGYVDYLIGRGDALVNAGHPFTGVVKDHFMSNLNFRVEKKIGYTGPGVISKLIIKNQITEAWISLCRGEYISSDLISPRLQDVEVRTSDQTDLYVFVVPQSSSEFPDSYFQVTIDGKEHRVEIPYNQTESYVWEKSKRYTYRFCLNANGSIVAELAEFAFGGDWDTSFTNPKVVVNPSGTADELSRPTPYWDDEAQSRKFEIAKTDLPSSLDWYQAASWIRQGGSVSNLKPGTSGCHTYNENGTNWRIPTYNELQYIYNQQRSGKLSGMQALSGVYWSGNRIQNKNHATYWNMTNGDSGSDSPSKYYKVRCVRDMAN